MSLSKLQLKHKNQFNYISSTLSNLSLLDPSNLTISNSVALPLLIMKWLPGWKLMSFIVTFSTSTLCIINFHINPNFSVGSTRFVSRPLGFNATNIPLSSVDVNLKLIKLSPKELSQSGSSPILL